MAEMSPNVVKPRINTKKSPPRYIIIKLLKTKDREKSCVQPEKNDIICKRTNSYKRECE